MTLKYDVLFKGRPLALAFVSPHPALDDHYVASVVPIEKRGKWQDSTLEIHFENPQSDIFPKSKKETDAINELLAREKIEPWKCTIAPR